MSVKAWTTPKEIPTPERLIAFRPAELVRLLKQLDLIESSLLGVSLPPILVPTDSTPLGLIVSIKNFLKEKQGV